MLTAILDIRNITYALKQVCSNKGSGGVDGMQTDELRDFMSTHWSSLKEALLNGSYQPDAVRKVEIPKPQGGTRMLGIPTVKDRLIQQAIAQWMSGLWEHEFHPHSYGFRPRKNAHQAVVQAQRYLEEGKTYVVELDLAKFFDVVNHDKLMSLIAKKISDKPTLKLIGKYLRSEIMTDGVSSQRLSGTPQGSPLSPLLSNILLNELDNELSNRGLSFVRYADDCSIYVRSNKSAIRVMRSVTKYIEEVLLLQVNREKSKISRPTASTLLGFSFYKTKGQWRIRIADKSLKRMKEKLRTLLPRNKAQQVRTLMSGLGSVIRGWVQYFQLGDLKSACHGLDELLRSRIRKLFWQCWQKIKTRMRHLMKLGISKWQSYQWSNTSKGASRTAHSPILTRSLSNKVLAKMGLVSFYQTYRNNVEIQQKLF
ncbi:MAG: group II intron reverse transcriptase/maturase [Chitinophagales bacterium]|nr:group II intron reverse transcriptase/maturase [Chitinophagales bacterium]